MRANLVDLEVGIVADSKSGVSGAGKLPTATTHFMHAADNLSAYAVFNHRHTGELREQLQLTREQITFTPHLLPIPRGILSTLYVRLNKACTVDELQSLFDTSTQTLRSSACAARHTCRRFSTSSAPASATSASISRRDHRRLIVISCLDNLLKGAASQAVENMNLMAGFHQQGLL